MRFEPVTLSAHEVALQAAVHEFVDRELPEGSYEPGLGMAGEHDPDFSRRLAAQGWVGMTLPKKYGGQGASAVERFLVTEVLLARGAPLGAHWVADRQMGPSILRHGTEAQRERFLPLIAAGDCYFSIGMSEPDSGSDLASIRTSAHRTAGGWRLRGAKTWTSMAHRNGWAMVLARSSRGATRHEGMSQFIVDLSAPGVSITPIAFMHGGHHFNDVVFDDVFVPDELVLGTIGQGWAQVTGELAFERSGPDRYLSTYLLFAHWLRMQNPDHPGSHIAGKLVAQLWGMRQMSLSIARSLDDGAAPALEAAIAKDLGTVFENEVIAAVREHLTGMDPDPIAETLLQRLLAESIVTAPTFTIRGGTTEILRTIIARGLVP